MIKAKKSKLICAIIIVAAMLSSCLLFSVSTKSYAAESISVDATKQYQTFDGWGTSLCWWADAVGGWTMEGKSGKPKRDEIMDLVFGDDGLRLNIARYNLAGGDDPTHTHMNDHRNMPGVKTSADGEFNWAADANQMWVLDQFNKLAGEDAISELFVNSAPYYMTQSGCSSGAEKKSDENLPKEKYGEFASWIADALAYFKDNGTTFDYVEPLNEPDSAYWGANGTQEGNKINRGANQSAVIMALKDELVSRGMGAQYGFTAPDETSTSMTNVSFNALTDDVKALVTKINSHTYSKDNTSMAALKKTAYSTGGGVFDFTDPNYKMWMSEVCYGSGDPDVHTSMMFPQNVGRDITSDLYTMGASAWVIWQAVESELSNMSYNNNYGLIHGIYQEPGNDEYGIDMDSLALSRGDYFVTKQYYAMGQYSRYIPKGSKIIDVNAGSVAALSPDGKSLTLVVRNESSAAKNIIANIKGFNGKTATKVVTSETKSWAESTVNAAGGINDSLDANSITTYVIGGEYDSQSVEAAKCAKINSALSYGNAINFTYNITDKQASYKLLYSENYEDLVTRAATLGSAMIDNEQTALTINDINPSKDYYAMLEVTPAVVPEAEVLPKLYTSIVAVTKLAVDADQAYFVDCGSSAKYAFFDEAATFTPYQSITDQKYAEDAGSGKSWGVTTANVESYSGEGLFASCIYSNEAELCYKFEMDDATTQYDIMMGFRDPWGVENRATNIYLNGSTEVSAFVESTLPATTASILGATAKEDGGKNYLTITFKKRAGNTSQNPAVNFISIRKASADTKIVSFITPEDIMIKDGLSVLDKLPKNVTAITTSGTQELPVEYLNINYAKLQTPDTTTVIEGKIVGQESYFKVNVMITPSFEQYYYYIDCAQTIPGSNSIDKFDSIKTIHQSTLLNTQQMDQPFKGTATWGYTGEVAMAWKNDPDLDLSLNEGKKNAAGVADHSLSYTLTGLTPQNYIFQLGFKEPDWGGRKMDVYINGTLMETVNLASAWATHTSRIPYEVKNSEPVTVKLVGQDKNPHMGSLIVKTVTPSGETTAPEKPLIAETLDYSKTEVKVSSLTEGAILSLTDQNNKCLVEYTVLADEHEKTFTDIDLSKVKSIKATQYKNHAKSATSVADVPQIFITEPRAEWGLAPDIIGIEPSTLMGVEKLEYRQEDGEWKNIKSTKFFRATQNGDYSVRMITKSGATVQKDIAVSKVDNITMALQTELDKWASGEVEVKFNLLTPSGIAEVSILEDTLTAAAGVYTFIASRAGEYIVDVTTTVGSKKSFPIAVNNIDNITPTIDVKVDYELGAMTGVVSSTSFSPATITVKNGDTESAVIDNKFVFVAGGEYEFIVTNSVGVKARKKVVYGADAQSAKNMKITVGEAINGAINISYAEVDGVTDIKVARIDGIKKDIAITDKKVTITENGIYSITSVKNGVQEVAIIRIDSFKAVNNVIADTTGGGLNAAASGLIAAAIVVFVTLAGLATLFILKKKNVIKTGRAK